LGRAPDGTLYPGANGNASGVAAMLEIARLWQEQEFQPRRSVLFAFWSGGELPYSGAHYFHDIPTGSIHRYNITAVINVDRMGSKTDDGMVVYHVDGQDNLLNLLVSSAERLGVDVQVDPSAGSGQAQGGAVRHRYQQVFGGQHGTLITTWGDPQPAGANDTADSINPHHLSQAAQVVNLTLITAAHEPRY
jgi:Zn-dependent M28 family amino/carboxypeptidase